jgi:lysozyme family protein
LRVLLSVLFTLAAVSLGCNKVHFKVNVMANHDIYFQKCLKWEGGYGNIVGDSGGATKYGVTIATWKMLADNPDKNGDGVVNAEDMKLLTLDDARMINKKFWDKIQGDKIINQSVAMAIADFLWNSGGVAVKKVQGLLRLTQDGIFGRNTLAAVNAADPKDLHQRITETRRQYFYDIVKAKPITKKFLHGWLNRLNDFKYEG